MKKIQSRLCAVDESADRDLENFGENYIEFFSKSN